MRRPPDPDFEDPRIAAAEYERAHPRLLTVQECTARAAAEWAAWENYTLALTKWRAAK